LDRTTGESVFDHNYKHVLHRVCGLFEQFSDK